MAKFLATGLTPMMGMRDTKFYGQQEDLTENWMTVPLIFSTATEIEEDADFQMYVKCVNC